MRPSQRWYGAGSTLVKYGPSVVSSQAPTLRMAASTALVVMAGERSVASGPGSSGDEPNIRMLSRSMPLVRISSVLGGATGVSVSWEEAAGAGAGVCETACCVAPNVHMDTAMARAPKLLRTDIPDDLVSFECGRKCRMHGDEPCVRQ